MEPARSPLRHSLSPIRPERSEASVSPAGTGLAIAGDDNFVPARDASNGQELLTRSGHIRGPQVRFLGGITAVTFSLDGKLLAGTGVDGEALFLDVGSVLGAVRTFLRRTLLGRWVYYIWREDR